MPRAPSRRRLTPSEWGDLSDGLSAALFAASVTPTIDARPHPAAHVARLRFGRAPIMAVGRTVWWPGVRADLAGTADMAVLQHELQHLLDYAEGRLSVAGYLLLPHNWTYKWRLGVGWDRLGAEQRASMAEALWHAERSPAQAEAASALRSVIPWAS